MTDYRFSLHDQLLARLHRSPIGEIKRCLRLAEQHQVPIDAMQLDGHYLAGGRIAEVVDALIYAKQNDLDLPVRRALVQDLAYGRKQSVRDWLIDCQRRGVKNLEREPFKEPC